MDVSDSQEESHRWPTASSLRPLAADRAILGHFRRSRADLKPSDAVLASQPGEEKKAPLSNGAFSLRPEMFEVFVSFSKLCAAFWGGLLARAPFKKAPFFLLPI